MGGSDARWGTAARPREKPPAPPSPNYITPEGARKLSEELGRLRSVERPKTVTEVADAAAQGDRSENAEYIYGKRRLREIDRRIRFLAKRLDAVTVVEPRERSDGRVYFGAWVTIEDDDGAEVEYRLVGPDEADGKANLVSIDSPIGKALLGKSEGDEITVARPKGRVTFSIVAVRYQGGTT